MPRERNAATPSAGGRALVDSQDTGTVTPPPNPDNMTSQTANGGMRPPPKPKGKSKQRTSLFPDLSSFPQSQTQDDNRRVTVDTGVALQQEIDKAYQKAFEREEGGEIDFTELFEFKLEENPGGDPDEVYLSLDEAEHILASEYQNVTPDNLTTLASQHPKTTHDFVLQAVNTAITKGRQLDVMERANDLQNTQYTTLYTEYDRIYKMLRSEELVTQKMAADLKSKKDCDPAKLQELGKKYKEANNLCKQFSEICEKEKKKAQDAEAKNQALQQEVDDLKARLEAGDTTQNGGRGRSGRRPSRSRPRETSLEQLLRRYREAAGGGGGGGGGDNDNDGDDDDRGDNGRGRDNDRPRPGPNNSRDSRMRNTRTQTPLVDLPERLFTIDRTLTRGMEIGKGVPDPKHFKNDDDPNFDSWYSSVLLKLTVATFRTEADGLRFVYGWTQGDPQRSIKPRIPVPGQQSFNEFKTGEELLDWMTRQYGTRNEGTKAMVDIATCKQEQGETFVAFHARYSKLRAWMSWTDETELMLFRNRLNRKYFIKTFGDREVDRRLDSMQDVIEECTALDESFYETDRLYPQKERPRGNGNSNSNGGQNNQNNGNAVASAAAGVAGALVQRPLQYAGTKKKEDLPTHLQNLPTLNREQREDLKKQGKCYRCRTGSHVSTNPECPMYGYDGDYRPPRPRNTTPNPNANLSSLAADPRQGNGTTAA